MNHYFSWENAQLVKINGLKLMCKEFSISNLHYILVRGWGKTTGYECHGRGWNNHRDWANNHYAKVF